MVRGFHEAMQGGICCQGVKAQLRLRRVDCHAGQEQRRQLHVAMLCAAGGHGVNALISPTPTGVGALFGAVHAAAFASRAAMREVIQRSISRLSQALARSPSFTG
ncbi:hypothetical protein ASD53_12930 [Lysobacter sp. Root559]|nr:hypothetical protein ASD53_12930 [Lysobacter sp. Root559]